MSIFKTFLAAQITSLVVQNTRVTRSAGTIQGYRVTNACNSNMSSGRYELRYLHAL